MAFAPLKAKKAVSPLDKRIPVNPRYAKVLSVIDTGAKLKPETAVSDKYIAKRRGEVFSRIAPSALAALLNKEDDSENIYRRLNDSAVPKLSLTNDGDLATVSPKDALFLMDVRSEEDFARCHIKGATHYPIGRISRDDISIALFKMKRKSANSHFVVYHDDDKSSLSPGTLMAQKGWEEVLVLTGGLEEFLKKFPGLVDGTHKNTP